MNLLEFVQINGLFALPIRHLAEDELALVAASCGYPGNVCYGIPSSSGVLQVAEVGLIKLS